jgi:RNA-dependent RNA polymerase
MDVSAISNKPFLFVSCLTTTTAISRFCTVLDGAKTGKTLLQEKYSQDRNNETYGTRYTPPWKEVDRDHNTGGPGQTSSIRLSRQSSLRPFVMDILSEEAQRAKDDCLGKIEQRFNSLPKPKDSDLIAPWQGAEEHAKNMLSSPEQNMRIIGEAHKSAMDAIEAHVVRVYDLSAEILSSARNAGARASTGCVGVGTSRAGARLGKGKSGKRGGGGGGGADFSNRSIEMRQDCLRRVSREFVGGPPEAETFVFSQEEVARLRASYAYLYDWTKHGRGGGTRFPWNVAFDELGEIKLRAHQDFKPISRDFYENMSIRKI